MKPRIAIPAPNSDAEYSTRALPDYLNSLTAAGAEPVLLPLDLTPQEAAQRIKECDGILLPGSPADVDTQKYGAERHPKTAAADPARGNLDELLLQDAHAMRKPLLGICYGTQSLNVWRGGSLVQHIESPVQHQRPDDKPRGFVIEHAATVEAGSRLAELTGAGEITVNSSHHQSVSRVGDGLRIVARSPKDGVVEAVEGIAAGHWVLGVQWHPERNSTTNEISRRIFARLVEEAAAFHRKLGAKAPDFENVPRENVPRENVHRENVPRENAPRTGAIKEQ
jgi:putative glutamine amidotransferase